MDINSKENEKEEKIEETSQNSQPQSEPKPEEKKEETQKPKLQVQNPTLQKMMAGEKFYMPKFKMPNFKEKFAEYGRVLKVTKKPDAEEFKAIVKASGIGIVVIGMVGFIIAIIVQLIQMI